MVIMKMLMMLVVVAILFFSHHQVIVAKEVVLVDERNESLSSSPAPATTCSANNQQQVKTCMYETTSIEACCPVFKKILGTSCPCYKYAEDLDNQILITLEAYCDVTTPCKGVQVIKLSKDE
ncbi:uncharacterized protein LOC107029491 [Solanum pennellii]|uniref:Uncharacterized protein LOC107029491 n=1 Tax=Solanum pennellii TaxID=28526 RepID=A0ABM1HJK0_SOLPN|nr:uncharacterized protein LOC107029491 [Solanum pennellii]